MTPEPENAGGVHGDNRLLAAAGPDRPAGRRVRLVAGQTLDPTGDVVWFPLTTVIRLETGDPLMLAGWIGPDGALGLGEMLSGAAADGRGVVEVGGEAWAAPRDAVSALLSQSAAFNHAVLAWMARGLTLARREAAFQARASAGERVVDLIETLDRLHGRPEGFAISQTEIARLTGVQRTTVCGVIVRLKREKRIVHTRGQIRLIRPVGATTG